MVYANQQAIMPKNKIRVVTACSLFDGHDAAINIMRRIMQQSGLEVIHLGHNRSVQEIVECAIQEDVQAIAMTSYQGGHEEFFKYALDLLKQHHCEHIKIFGGGGGTILPDEMKILHDYGICRIYSPDDGRKMGLQGMINDMIAQCDFPSGTRLDYEENALKEKSPQALAQYISVIQNNADMVQPLLQRLHTMAHDPSSPLKSPIIGITGTGGSGKSSIADEFVRRFLMDFPDKHIAIVSVDPSKRKTGGALLGDRIRMNSIHHPHVYMRSIATRQSNLALSKDIKDILLLLKYAAFDLIILETSGIGQSDTEIVDHSDISVYVMTPEYGASSQLEKIDMLDFAHVIVINKSDKRGAQDALRDVKKQYRRNHQQFDMDEDAVPVYATIASKFNEPGVNKWYKGMIHILLDRCGLDWKSTYRITDEMKQLLYIIPPNRERYLSEIADTIRSYNRWVEDQSAIADTLYGIQQTKQALLTRSTQEDSDSLKPTSLDALYQEVESRLEPSNLNILQSWNDKKSRYEQSVFTYIVRDKPIEVDTYYESLSHTQIPKVILPEYKGWGDILRWNLQENVPGEFPYTAGVYPFKRKEEDPTRMFAGEGTPEKTNRRFHYISQGQPAIRLSTAFDSITLYGEDPDYRPDIYGKIGNSGVSICCLDDMKKLYSGFDLAKPTTSVSMTINGPSAIMTAFFMNTAIDQHCEKYIHEHGLQQEVQEKIRGIFEQKGVPQPKYRGDLPTGNDGLGLMLLGVTGNQVLPKEVYEPIKAKTLSTVRGTVQADILKEDQAQNTCIFSTEVALRMMGDMQEYFIQQHIRNFYSVSISGYHIAEAGANPITQLALTLSNGFTLLEYYFHRGMQIDDFAANFSFFFSNGIDPEYAVIGRVARRIWSKALKLKYGANARSQLLKYHIQTSGRSLHAQEITFNDIRTTLQALYGIYDNCNSLHTNAYDEAITTPTEDSVRQAIAIQMIINKELGLNKNENPLQGSFIIEKLTELVEEAVLQEFDRITERGGVLGAMETMYQRGKIQDESLYYESMKHSGEYPIVGVNTFLSSTGSPTVIPNEVSRSTPQEKEDQIQTRNDVIQRNHDQSPEILNALCQHVVQNKNIFAELVEAAKFCTLGQLTNTLYQVGGKYRRSM